MCRQGASVIQEAVLNTVKDPSLRVYVAWVPILATDRETPDQDTISLVFDKRSLHFWDGAGKLLLLFQKTLGLGKRPAWDVYLVYPPGVTWEDEPPTPAYWQHQLGGVTSAPFLDGKTFAKVLRRVLEKQNKGK